MNVGPKGDGEIPKEDQRILREIGMWMEKNESAVFGSKPWRKAAEGSVRVSEGQFTDNEELPYTKEDIRFTANGDSIYAFVMRYPKDGDVTIRSLAESDNSHNFVSAHHPKPLQKYGHNKLHTLRLHLS